ncbi:MAG: CoB--CoM heterodisulfide reductase iron-sulfur subunit B family protein [Anaerolineae bacterium]|nr:CoB--CoM heterodisulfide reductase iron-sulfur subunit B family protein [Anaerolineae bacterium]
MSTATKYTYYPGCTSETTAVEFGRSTEAVCEALGVELIELDDWNCCGASSAHTLDHELALALPGRNVALAQEGGLDMVIPCPACYQHCRDADIKMREDQAWREKMERILDFRYQGEARPRHLLEVLSNDLDEDELQEKVVKPLEGLKVASYYGCVLVRPPELTGWDDPEHPVTMDRLMAVLGTEVIDWSYKVDCCGASMTLARGDIVAELSTKIIEGAAEAGADCIVSACGMCEINLDTRQAPESGKKMPIFYLTELMALALGLPNVEKWLRRHAVDPRPLLRERGLL